MCKTPYRSSNRNDLEGHGKHSTSSSVPIILSYDVDERSKRVSRAVPRADGVLNQYLKRIVEKSRPLFTEKTFGSETMIDYVNCLTPTTKHNACDTIMIGHGGATDRPCSSIGGIGHV